MKKKCHRQSCENPQLVGISKQRSLGMTSSTEKKIIHKSDAVQWTKSEGELLYNGQFWGVIAAITPRITPARWRCSNGTFFMAKKVFLFFPSGCMDQ